MKLTEIVITDAIVTDLEASERDDAIRTLVEALITAGAADESIKDELLERILERERKGSTGFGRGVAVPHVKHPKIEKLAAAVGLSQGGIDFNALDRQPVYSIIMLLSPEDAPEEHLQAMEAIFKNLTKPTFRRFLKQAETVEEVVTLLGEADNQQLAG